MIRVLVSGICGRMGTLVGRSIAARDDMELSGGVEIPGHANVGRRLCEVWGVEGSEMRVAPGLDDFGASEFDVIVDFSVPAQAVRCAETASALGKGLVVGTTGLTELQLAVVQEASTRCPVVVAANTTVAMNLLFGLVRRAASVLGADYDVEIIETHHRHKKDAPSGTAEKLIRIVSSERDLDPVRAARLGRSGASSGREPEEIGVHSLRVGAVVGRHEVRFVSDMEEMTLSHEAFTRDTFAAGAVRAVAFVHGRAPGLYDMQSVLGLD
jgi:4-hydroxy-tetrahydrodipicolinate reductase